MLKALRNQRDGFIAMAQLVCQNAKKMQRRRMLRLNRQHFPVQGLSLDQLALLVAFYGAYHRFLGGELPLRAWWFHLGPCGEYWLIDQRNIHFPQGFASQNNRSFRRAIPTG